MLSERQIGMSPNRLALAHSAGVGAALNLTAAGINVNLAPVLDVFRQPGDFIDEFQRSYSSDPQVAAELGAAFISAQQPLGVAATAKHFPGLGAATRNQNTDAAPVVAESLIERAAPGRRGALPSRHRRRREARDDIVGDLPRARPSPSGRPIPCGHQGELRRRLGFDGHHDHRRYHRRRRSLRFGSLGQRGILGSTSRRRSHHLLGHQSRRQHPGRRSGRAERTAVRILQRPPESSCGPPSRRCRPGSARTSVSGPTNDSSAQLTPHSARGPVVERTAFGSLTDASGIPQGSRSPAHPKRACPEVGECCVVVGSASHPRPSEFSLSGKGIATRGWPA